MPFAYVPQKMKMSFNIVLVEPEIPQNTGNISRTCAVTDCSLHLIKPLGFSIEEKHLKRAGLDYWQYLDLHVYENLDDFFNKNPNGDFYYFSTKAPKRYTDVSYPDGAFLIFGKETKGLPEELLEKNLSKCVRIPMKGELRSLNLSNSVAIAVYEALRQNDFFELTTSGKYGNI